MPHFGGHEKVEEKKETVKNKKVLTHSDLRRCAACSRRNYDSDYLNKEKKMTGYCSNCRKLNPLYEKRVIPSIS